MQGHAGVVKTLEAAMAVGQATELQAAIYSAVRFLGSNSSVQHPEVLQLGILPDSAKILGALLSGILIYADADIKCRAKST